MVFWGVIPYILVDRYHFCSSLAGNSDVAGARYAVVLVCDLMTNNLQEMRLKFSTFTFSSITY
jgi:hypothetical protein